MVARRFRLPLLALAFWCAGGPPLEGADPPRVRLIATGGTIANRGSSRLTADDLIKSVPGLERVARAEAEQFSNVGSAALTLGQWLQLARRINELLARPGDLAGIVVASGTDTLEETAYFLHLTVRSDRPVVLVGSMRGPSAVGYDGAANLLQAFRVAADPASRGKGVLVVLNGEINSAREVSKTNTQQLDTFSSGHYGVLGTVDERVQYYRGPLKRHTTASEFDVSRIDALPRVDVVMTYQGAPGDLITAAVGAGARGVVVASAGAGTTTAAQREAIASAGAEKITVVISSRTGSGRVTPAGAPGRPARPQPFTVYAEDLPPLKARVLLMLALTRTSDPAEIQRMFGEY